MENPVIIFGANGLGKVALDIFKSNLLSIYGFLDDDTNQHHKTINDVKVLGDTHNEEWLHMIGKNCDAFVAIEDIEEKRRVIAELAENKNIVPVSAVHHTAFIESTAKYGQGTLVGAGAKLLSNVVVGKHCVVRAGTLVDHDAKIGDFVHIGIGSIICAEVEIEDDVEIGSGVTIVSGIHIGKGARISSGSVVIKDVRAEDTVFGSPAQLIQYHHFIK